MVAAVLLIIIFYAFHRPQIAGDVCVFSVPCASYVIQGIRC